MRAALLVVLAVLLEAGWSPAGAQPSPARTRPTIGLALGGGVARGIAHIGVIEWLEEHRVPVDLIAGTSAGGLVGGIYATGMTPAELRALIASIEWDLMFERDAPYAAKDFRRKEDALDYPARVEVGFRSGFRAPSGLAPTQPIDLLLGRVTRRYFNVRSFDDLPIPFRCVATDLIAEESVVLSDGPLAEALRATMAFPGLFSPVRRGGRLLVDGGVLNNVPADVVRAMGADIVIAVDVGKSTPLEPGPNSAITVLSRTLDVLTDQNVRRILQTADIVLKPDVKDITAMDWRRHAEIADRGYRAAASEAKLAALSVDEPTWSAHVAARDARRMTADPVPVSLAVSGVPAEEAGRIRARLLHHLGRPLDPARIGADLTAISGSGRYDAVTYRLVPRSAGVELAIEATPKPYGPPFVRFGLDVTNSSNTVATVGIRSRLTALDVAGYGSEMRIDAAIGTGFELGTELYKPIGGSRLFVAPRAAVHRSDRQLFDFGHGRAEYRTDRAFLGADLGLNLGRTSEWRLGITYGRGTSRVRTGPSDAPEFGGPERAARMQFIYDGQDRAAVPSRGVRLRAEVHHILKGMEPQPAYARTLGTGRRTLAEVDSSVFFPVRDRHRVAAAFTAGTSFGAGNDSYYTFLLRGLTGLWAADGAESRGRNYVLGSAAYLHHLGRLPDILGGPIYLAGVVEAGGSFASLSSARIRTVVAAGIVMDTLVGPASLTGGISPSGHFRVCVNVGRSFR